MTKALQFDGDTGGFYFEQQVPQKVSQDDDLFGVHNSTHVKPQTERVNVSLGGMTDWSRDSVFRAETQRRSAAQAGGGLLGNLQSTQIAGIDPEAAARDPSKAQGELLDKQWQLFEDRYRPIEDSAIQEFLKGTQGAAADAGKHARRSLAGAKGITDRALGRRGVTMTGDQRAAADSSRGLNAARTIATAENTARSERRDRNLEGLGTMMGIGKGISGSAGENMGAASGLQHQREQQNAAAKQARRQQNTQTAVSVAGMAMMAAVMM